MDIVTFETAVKLKEAGFVQPTTGKGQFWYSNADLPFFVTGRLGMHFYGLFVGIGGMSLRHEMKEVVRMTFAPTSTDILKESKGVLELRTSKHHAWICSFNKMYFEHHPIMRDTPAEAAAEAWLKLNTKPKI